MGVVSGQCLGTIDRRVHIAVCQSVMPGGRIEKFRRRGMVAGHSDLKSL